MWLGLRGPTPPRGSHLPPARKFTYCKLQGICLPRPLPKVSGHRLWAPENHPREGLWAPTRNSGHHLGVCSSTRQSPVVAASLAPGEGVAGKAGQPVIAATSLVAATGGRQAGIRILRSPFPSSPPSRSLGSGRGRFRTFPRNTSDEALLGIQGVCLGNHFVNPSRRRLRRRPLLGLWSIYWGVSSWFLHAYHRWASASVFAGRTPRTDSHPEPVKQQ